METRTTIQQLTISYAGSEKMNTSTKNCENFQFLSKDLEDISSLIHDFSAKLTFRDTEDFHTTLLSAAQAEHTRVRERALRLLKLEQIRYEEEKLRIKSEAEVEEKRIRVESEKALEACRLKNAENKARQIANPKPLALVPPKNKGTSSTSSPVSVRASQTNLLPTKTTSLPTTISLNRPTVTSTASQTVSPTRNIQEKPILNTISASLPLKQSVSTKSSTFNSPQPLLSIPPKQLPKNDTPNRPFISNISAVKQPAPIEKPPCSVNLQKAVVITPNSLDGQYLSFRNQCLGLVDADKYRQIHAKIKKLRNHIESQVDQNGKSTLLRTTCNKGRREITKALGQLVVGGNNAAIVDKVIRLLLDSLQDRTDYVEASLFTTKNNEAVSKVSFDPHDIIMNAEKLPMAFIYLLGSFCKAVCAQLVSEAAVKPQAASPIGILAAHVFSEPRLHWRNISMIDMLISKIFVACPVLFGVRGDESTHEGRTRIGWRKIDGKFISEQAHFDRMSGIAAGYAAISLRDFSRTTKKNPYPAFYYWFALSAIVNTPQKEACPSQFVVLKALIEHSFPLFIMFYGDMAIAALQAALIEFPKRGPQGNTSVGTLKTLAETLKKDHGLTLY